MTNIKIIFDLMRCPGLRTSSEQERWRVNAERERFEIGWTHENR